MQKNKYIKHTHISEGKFREILRLFCADVTSTQIAEIAKVNRNTINRMLQLLRKRIVELAESESCFEVGEIDTHGSHPWVSIFNLFFFEIQFKIGVTKLKMKTFLQATYKNKKNRFDFMPKEKDALKSNDRYSHRKYC